MEETDWFPLTACPVRPGVYKTLHLGQNRVRREGYSNWIPSMGWSFTEATPQEAAKRTHKSGQQSKQWKGLTEGLK